MAAKDIGLTKDLLWFICLMGLFKSVLHFACYLESAIQF